jgi:NAD+ synthase (glutamine-hydrolysing)
MPAMRVGLAQLNLTVGDLDGNAAKLLNAAHEALTQGCELLATPELALTGYPPQDLLFKRHFITAQLDVLDQLAAAAPLPMLVGFVSRREEDGTLRNAAAVIEGGRVKQAVEKMLLPTYDVFDELRYFRPACLNIPVQLAGHKLGVTICEDIWDAGYERKVVPQLARQGSEAIINLSSSPFHAGKRRERIEICRRHALAHGLPVLYCNLVGAQDELVFDGESLALDARGRLIALGPQFREELVVVDCGAGGAGQGEVPAVPEPTCQHACEVFGALCLGTRDYFRKCGFSKAVLGLSGGVDSALVACVAAEALGPENVLCMAMPSRYTAEMSNTDAELLARNLGVEFKLLPIEDSVRLAMQRYNGAFGEYKQNVTVENLQARERGKILMEISNDQNALVLATGNKTEYALGYSTLYGDMCGGLAVIGDVSKPDVYALCRYYNESRGREVLPQRILTRAPSAELREGQVDPFDYDRISPLADAVVEEHCSPEELMERGYSREEVDLVLRLVRLSEYKRKQAAPILRVTAKAFGIGRRLPIVNRYKC